MKEAGVLRVLPVSHTVRAQMRSSKHIDITRHTPQILGLQVGHAGTLDPMATGLLVVCTGSGTKFVDDYQAMEKEYSGAL